MNAFYLMFMNTKTEKKKKKAVLNIPTYESVSIYHFLGAKIFLYRKLTKHTAPAEQR